MILQCDQCSTKFRLDDARLKPGGVKVRCSKCRHVFLAGADFKQEESEFDAILSGLGAPVAGKSDAVAPGAVGSDVFGFDSESIPGPAESLAATAESASAPAQSAALVAPAESHAPFAQESAAPFVPAESAAPFASAESPATFAQDFAAPFAPAEPAAPFAPAEPAAPFAPAEPAEPAAPFASPGPVAALVADESALREPDAASDHTAPSGGRFGQQEVTDFAAFDFPSEPFEVPKESAPSARPVKDFSAFDFAPETPPEKGKEATSTASGLDYGEFTFDEEPALLKEEPAAAQDDAFDFGEFSFSDEPVTGQEQVTPAPLDFSEFDFDAHPATTSPEPEPALPELDYGDFSFPSETPSKQEESAAAPVPHAPAATEDAFDFGAFSFSEEPSAQQEEEPASAKHDFDFSEFSFAEEPPPAAEPAVTAEASPPAASFSVPEPAGAWQPEQPPAASKAAEGFDFDDFSFSPDPATAPLAAAAGPADAPAPSGTAQAPAPTQAPAVESPASTAPLFPLGGEAALDFGLGTPVPTRTPERFELDDEALPPLSIVSRRKGRSLLTVSVIAGSVLAIVALSGAGFYLMQSGPAAFDRLGIGFVAKWFGMESAEEGRMTVRNQQASFSQNKEAGELFVVTGEAVNSFRNARASILVKVSIFDKKGAVLLQKTAYCGNRLTAEQLATLPLQKIESVMNNPFGDSLSNLGVQSGSAIGFVVALANVPKEAADFGVEVVSSTVAGK
jgi:predicted Zn finger-like uncharacterized protein